MAQLLSALKDYLQITWSDETLERKLQGALARGMSLLDSYAGAHLDYTVPGAAQGLLFDYCRYVRSDATEMFETNYRHDLMMLRQLTQADEEACDAQN